jgi:hypothetical protein
MSYGNIVENCIRLSSKGHGDCERDIDILEMSTTFQQFFLVTIFVLGICFVSLFTINRVPLHNHVV